MFDRPEEVEEILRAAEGNFDEIYDFLSADLGCTNGLKIELLRSLNKKDLIDVKRGVLEAHLTEAAKRQNSCPPEIFAPYVMCPRVNYEEITAYRKFILTAIGRDNAELFKKQPAKAWEYVSKFQTKAALHSERLAGTPEGIVKSGLANEAGRKLLFVAIMRTLGVPARINKLDGAAQFYREEKFWNTEKAEGKEYSARLILKGGTENWVYGANWTLAALHGGVYNTLDLSGSIWEKGETELRLIPGNYRLLTSNRMPNGNQFARKYCFGLSAGRSKTVEISLREAGISDMACDMSLPPIELTDEKGDAVVPAKNCAAYVWLAEDEPSEHILNEFIESKDAVNNTGCEVFFVSESQAGETLGKALVALDNAKLCRSDPDTAESTARAVFVDPESLPVLVLVKNGRGIYACSGYNVGVIGLMIKILALA